MSNSNPLVKETAQETFDQIINTLAYVTTSLSKVAGVDETTACMTAADVAGLCNIVQSIKNATEICYEQSTKE
jgi:hypothetical protein